MVYHFNPDAAYREVGGELFIVTPDRAMHHVVRPTAVSIVKTLREGPVAEEQIVTQICDQFEVTTERAAVDVQRFLDDLIEKKIAQPV